MNNQSNPLISIFLSKKILKALVMLIGVFLPIEVFGFQRTASKDRPVEQLVERSDARISGKKTGNDTTKDRFGVPDTFTKDLKRRTFNYFWDVVDTATWQTDDRYPTRAFTSVAATGFALPAYIIGIHNAFISREQGAERTLKVLKWLWEAPQGPDKNGNVGYKGFFYHFLNYQNGTRFKQVELSTVDTGLLIAGVLTAQSYFDQENPTEHSIRSIADSVYRRVQWDWAMNGKETMSMGWHPESGFIKAQWEGYNEAMVLLILALGSPEHAIPKDSWKVWTSTYKWDEFYGYDYVGFGPLFGHQYSQMFIDFRGIQDEYMRRKDIDYFENSRRAVLANRAYCIKNPSGFVGYSENIWGLTACDGPANENRMHNGTSIEFRTYNARGAAKGYIVDDGTISPTAAGGSIPFTPEESLKALYTMKQHFGSKLYSTYGFLDSFNLTYNKEGWFNPDYISIDQGPILIQLENWESGLIWKTLRKNTYIRAGLEKAGFQGGWLEKIDS